MDWTAIAGQVETLLSSQKGVYIPFTWEGAEFHGARTALKMEDYNLDEGLAGNYSFSLLCPCSQFAGTGYPPPRTAVVECAGKSYRVLSSMEDAAGACIRLDLGELTA